MAGWGFLLVENLTWVQLGPNGQILKVCCEVLDGLLAAQTGIAMSVSAEYAPAMHRQPAQGP